MKEIVLISSVVVSALLFFLVYKTMKNETHFKNEITRLNRQINELNSSVLLKEKNKLISAQENDQTQQSNLEGNTEESNLATEYNTYLENNFGNQGENQNAELSPELKEKINQLEQQNNGEFVEYNQYMEQGLEDLREPDSEINENQDIVSSEQGVEGLEDVNVGVEGLEDVNVEELEDDNVGVEELEDVNVEELEDVNVEELEDVNVEGLEDVNVEGLEDVNVENIQDFGIVSGAVDNIVNQTLSNEESIIENVMNVQITKESVNSYKSYSLGDFEKMTIKELQEIARANRLKVKGKKNELVERVKAFYNFNNNL